MVIQSGIATTAAFRAVKDSQCSWPSSTDVVETSKMRRPQRLIQVALSVAGFTGVSASIRANTFGSAPLASDYLPSSLRASAAG
ncbi:hypothetical protein CVS28_13650 [Arthrobacter glacialis]|nr:hypothetical protein CVS28_13650 [Arthrobacter glacialis]